jgi:hypothetical protein
VGVGQFIQRHIPQLLTYFGTQTGPPPDLSAVPEPPGGRTTPEIVDNSTMLQFMDYSHARFETRLSELRAENKVSELPDHGAWEAACVITGCELNHTASTRFLDDLFIHQPRYTGWPMWRDTRNSQADLQRPYTFERGWESLVVRLRQMFYNHIDFWRIEPRGRFSEYRALEDDVSAARGDQQIPPLKVLDFLLPIARVHEAIAVCLQYAKGLGCPADETVLKFGFRWRKLRARVLESWVEPMRTLFPGAEAIQDEAVAFVDVPLTTGIAQVSPFVRMATVPLFEIFGKEFPLPLYEEIGAKVLQRR